MTSPTALAAGHAAAPAFNADFYMTAATVIPVLFLAIAVQGSTYTDILRIAHDAGDRTGPYAPTSGSRREAIGATTAYVAAARLGVFVLVYGVFGEILALISLAERHALGQGFVFGSAVVLIIVAAMRPAVALVKAIGFGDARPQPRDSRSKEPD
jgi:hypothetical protein